MRPKIEYFLYWQAPNPALLPKKVLRFWSSIHSLVLPLYSHWGGSLRYNVSVWSFKWSAESSPSQWVVVAGTYRETVFIFDSCTMPVWMQFQKTWCYCETFMYWWYCWKTGAWSGQALFAEAHWIPTHWFCPRKCRKCCPRQRRFPPIIRWTSGIWRSFIYYGKPHVAAPGIRKRY